jgi:hypothetical protein
MARSEHQHQHEQGIAPLAIGDFVVHCFLILAVDLAVDEAKKASPKKKL